MLEIIGMAAAGAAAVAGHLKSKEFVARRLRYTSFVENPVFGVMAGGGETGVAMGASRARSRGGDDL